MYLKGYLRRHIKVILLLTLSAAVFAAVFSLYELPVEAVGYASLLCLALGGALFAVGYARYVGRHRVLDRLRGGIALSLDGLPGPRGLPEADYQALLRLLFEEKNRIAAQAEDARSDAAEYYTLWAHQIKTPIAAMRLLLQSEEGRREEALSLELFKIEQYVEMVLQYLRLDSNSTDYVLGEYELDEIVRQAVRKYARLFIARRIALDFTETGLRVTTDEKWLVFVLEQLLSNALKYTPEGGKIFIAARDGDLTVEDNGIGIRPEDLPRVFEKGYTGYNGRMDKRSTGIGLYLCRRVLTRLGHTVSIESAVGAGTRVTLGLGRGE